MNEEQQLRGRIGGPAMGTVVRTDHMPGEGSKVQGYKEVSTPGHLDNPCFSHLLDGRPSASYLVSLCFSFPICRIVIEQFFMGWLLDLNELSCVKHLEQCLTYCEHSIDP